MEQMTGETTWAMHDGVAATAAVVEKLQMMAIGMQMDHDTIDYSVLVV